MKKCDVQGCGSLAQVELLDDEDGLRCRTCLEYDLNRRVAR